MSWPKGNQFWILTGRTDAEAEAPILWPPDEKNWLIIKDPDAGKDWRHEEKESTEDETIGWHHRLCAHELEQVPGAGDGQGSLACCSPWGHKESDMTEWLNWTELKSFPRSRYSQGFKERPQGPENLKDSSIPSGRSWDGMSIEQLCWFKINILPIAQFCQRLVGVCVCVCVCVYALGKLGNLCGRPGNSMKGDTSAFPSSTSPFWVHLLPSQWTRRDPCLVVQNPWDLI